MVYGIALFHLETSEIYYIKFYSEEGNNMQRRVRTQFICRNIMKNYIFKKQSANDFKK